MEDLLLMNKSGKSIDKNSKSRFNVSVKEILYWLGFLILVFLVAMWLGVLPGLELPNILNSVWWGTAKDLMNNQNWFDYSCDNFAYPIGVKGNEAFTICFLTRIFLTMGISEVLSLSLCFFVLYLSGAFSLIFLLRIICKNKGCQYLGFLLYYLVPILQANTAIAQTYFGYLFIPVCILADCCLAVYIQNEEHKISKAILLFATHLLAKLLLVGIGWYLSVIYASVSCLCLQILILFAIKKNNKKRILQYELLFVGIGVVTWFIAMYLIKLLIPAGTEDFSYPMERFNGSSVDLLTCFIPSITQKLSDYISINDFIPEGMLLTGDSGFHSNYIGFAILICNFYGVINKKYRTKYSITLFIVAIIMFVLACGPAFKFCKFIPEDASVYSVSMEGQFVFPWKFLWYIFPISDMRTVYRWMFGSYICLIINASYILSNVLENEKKNKKRRIFAICVIGLMIIEYFPNNTFDSVKNKFDNYQMAVQQKNDMCDEIRPYIEESSIAVISNMGGRDNHYSCQIIASGLNIKVYNVSGDKNAAILSELPGEISNIINQGDLDELTKNTITVLENDEADYVIFPAFDLRTGATKWPDDQTTLDNRNASINYLEEYFSGRYECVRTEHYLIVSK